jgi:hypothetical protein
MSYQRWGKPGRFYVWCGNDGLHIWPPGSEGGDPEIMITADVAGRDNAEAIISGLVDLLDDLGVDVTVRKGKCEFTRKAPSRAAAK